MAVCENPRLLPGFCKSPLLKRRKRVGFINKIAPVSYWGWNTVYDVNSTIELVLEPEPEKLSRTRRRRRRRERLARGRIPTPLEIRQSRLLKIMDGLYIAIVPEGGLQRGPYTFEGEKFTHVVQINFHASFWEEDPEEELWVTTESDQGKRMRSLDLFCPPVYIDLSPEQTAVRVLQLIKAREFLSLALPYGGERWWPKELHEDFGLEREAPLEVSFCVGDEERDEEHKDIQVAHLAHHCILDEILTEFAPYEEERGKTAEKEGNKQKPANVLIVAPEERVVDVLAILLCYLSYVEGSTLDELAKKGYLDKFWDGVPLGPLSKLDIQRAAAFDLDYDFESLSALW